MSTTDIRTAFEYWFSDEGAHPKAIERSSNGGYILAAASQAWNVWQAATEAAKATGTAGEIPPLPDPLEINWPELNSNALGCGVEDRGIRDRYEAAEYGWQDGVDKAIERVPEAIYDADQMRAYGKACAEAARQPAPVAIKTWQERLKDSASEGWTTLSETHMQAEIADLRAALAATAAPVLSDERDNEIFELQKALAFWLPQINEFMSGEMSKRIAHDAYMLVIDGNLPDDFKTAQELGWILPATGKVQEGSEMVCGNCMEPIAATRSQP